MNTIELETRRLKLVLKTPADVRAWIASVEPSIRKEMSADWLAQVAAATEADPWVHGFSVVDRESGAAIGHSGFKGPPSAEGMVEIAYGIESEHQGKGYATEAAQALVDFALQDSQVRIVRAHTFEEQNASTRVLTKCGFRKVGEVVDPEDGLVWRWEKVESVKK